MATHPSIIVLTGAGISAESGVPTFRGAGGLWEGHRIEDVASPTAFARDPALVHRFYNLRRAAMRSVEPNVAHVALARLEREHGGSVLLVTQNVDDLHERAGSSKLLHMHGELRKARCEACGEVTRWEDDLGSTSPCPACELAGWMRPHIVWFGEMPFHLDQILKAVQRADVFVSIGTSGVVYPAAAFADMAGSAGARTIEINPVETAISSDFQEHRIGRATDEVPKLVEELLALA